MSAPDWRALPAGAALDALVAERVMGWTVAHYVRAPFGGDMERRVGYSEKHTNYYETADGENPDGRKLSDMPTHSWSPSTDLGDAWEVVVKLHERCCDFTLERVNTEWHADFRTGYGVADSAPLAICRAALDGTAA